MKRQNKKIILSLFLLLSLFRQTIPIYAQSAEQTTLTIQPIEIRNESEVYRNLLWQTRGKEFTAIIEKVFGEDAENTFKRFDEESEKLLQAVTKGAGEKAAGRLQKQIEKRKADIKMKPAAETKTPPAQKTPIKRSAPKSKKLGFNAPPKLDWRQFAFGFQPLTPQLQQDETGEVKFKETDKEIIAEGEQTRKFETKDARGTRTQKAETRYIKDGKVFGVEIKNTEIIEAFSKADGKTFRTETVMMWGAEVAACPDAGGISSGKGQAKATIKTTYTDGGQTTTLMTDLDLQGRLTGYVNDEAELTNYDFAVDAYISKSGADNPLLQNPTKETKLKDGRYGVHFDIKGNTIEVRESEEYGSKRTPEKFGKVSGRKLTAMTDEEAKISGSSLGAAVSAIWIQANNMYESAQKNWKNNGCVEVICKAPKDSLKIGEQINITAETVQRDDKRPVNARLEAEVVPGTISPESQNGTPSANFTFTKEDDGISKITFKSVSKRGIGEGRIEFSEQIDEPEEPGAWTGKIVVRRYHRQEKEKRSGGNLEENGGFLDTQTNVTLRLTGRLDRTVDAANANIALVTGKQLHFDLEYYRFKVDEGFCGPNAVPYKGEKEMIRDNKTTSVYKHETIAYIEIGGTGGTITFSLPEINGTAVYVNKQTSECREKDLINTTETIIEDSPTIGGSFAFSFPIEPSQKIVRGTTTVTDKDGSRTEYEWELRRR